MNIQQEVNNLKKELVFLRIKKVTQQKTENHKIKKIQHQISKINQLHNKNKYSYND
uniref:Ribosomal protein L29 n=1 Tax=Leptosiphonia brodiei TaxID=2608611 RepID=A0A1Z1MAD1_9FLOR|nr:ribosomal protein L29 [Leptosiphonia brodiei]ARW62946.1 ribosomal protein L29 [Leptosiphonia brodiei]